MVQAQFARIEKKLFTKQENFDFMLGLARDMIEEEI